MTSLLLLLAASPALSAPPPVTAIAYRPDGTILAVGTRGEVLLLNAKTAAVRGAIDGLTNRVTGLAFTKSGLLAIASGDPGESGLVRLVDCTHPTHPKTLIEFPAHDDIIYALAFSPDGKTLATTGYDRLIRLWDIPAKSDPKPRRTLTDHSDTVYGLSFHPTQPLLASVSADRAVKVWDTTTGQRLYTLSEPTDWLYTVAWSPDGNRLAAAGADRSVRIWEADRRGGKLIQSAFAHEGTVTQLHYTSNGRTLYTIGDDRRSKAWDASKLVESKLFDPRPDTILSAALSPDGQRLALGSYDGTLVLIDTKTGKVAATPKLEKPKFDRFPEIAEAEVHAGLRLPATVIGVLSRAGEVDRFDLSGKPGEELGLELRTTADPKKFEPILTIADARGQVLSEGTRLGVRFDQTGPYSVSVRDREYRGGADLSYRLDIGPVPVVTTVFPPAVPRGVETPIRIEGVHLGAKTPLTVRAKPPAEAVPGSRFPVQLQNGPKVDVIVNEFPLVAVDPKNGATLTEVPMSACGTLTQESPQQLIHFSAKKGQRLLVEAHALGSPVDPAIEIVDAAGQPVPQAVLRCTARVYVSFRDHDATRPGIRLETWNELAVDDLVFLDGELMKILALPRNPDDDCRFYEVDGKRVAFLGTTPNHHAMGAAMYKVEVHPPGATFPPNGMPTFPLAFRNDDGGPGCGKDSLVVFDPPTDGQYTIRMTDATGATGANHSYRVTVRSPRPDFQLRVSPTLPKIERGSAVALTVTATRVDGYDGPIAIEFEGLPAGFTAPQAVIEAGQNTATFPLAVDSNAAVGEGPTLRIVGHATIAGRELVHNANGGKLTVTEPGDIAVSLASPTVAIQPGREARMIARLDRRNGYTGRVPLDVQGLPHGVRVLNVGLNGILVTPTQKEREIVLFAEPWVKPMERPIAVTARHEKKGTTVAAPIATIQVKP